MIYLFLVCQRQDADIPTSFRVSVCHFKTLSFVELFVRDTMAPLSTNCLGLLLCHVTNYVWRILPTGQNLDELCLFLEPNEVLFAS